MGVPWVREYVRRDGTRVRGYSRWAAGGRRELPIVVIVGLAVVVLGNPSNSAGDPGRKPDPSTSVYPVKFPGVQKSTARPRPQPTVSYPIRFPKVRKAPARPGPRSTVRYPIPWDRGSR